MTDLRLFAVIGIFIYFGILLLVVLKEKKSDSMEDYFFAGRKLPFWALSITFIASWWGAGSALSTADLAYSDGLGAFWVYGMPVLFSTFLMIIFAKAIRKVGSFTQPQMLNARYGKTCALITTIMIFAFMTITAASQMVGVGNFFSQYLGIDYRTGVLLGTGIVLVYSMFGGFRGVVVTDIIQFVFLTISTVVIFLVSFTKAGGIQGISAVAASAGKPDYMSFTAGFSTNITYILTFGAAWMIQANVWQRISAAKNANDAKKMTTMSFFVYIPLYLMAVLTGMAGLVLYKELPASGIIPSLITDYMHPIVGALMFIGIASAIMSTMDSLINTGALMISEDIYRQRINPTASNTKLMTISRLSTLAVTLIGVVISLKIQTILEVSWIAADIISTGVFFPLILGFLWKRGTQTGAIVSMSLGGMFCFYNFLIQMGIALPHFWESGSALQVILGMSLSLTSYIVGSLLSKPQYDKAEDFIKTAGLIK